MMRSGPPAASAGSSTARRVAPTASMPSALSWRSAASASGHARSSCGASSAGDRRAGGSGRQRVRLAAAERQDRVSEQGTMQAQAGS